MNTKSTIVPMTAEELSQLLAGTELFAVIDVRERGEYILGHIPGSTNVPRGRLEIALPDLISVRTVQLVLYCDDTHRSWLAANSAQELGYERVRVLESGLEGWSADGHELDYGVNVVGKDYGERLAVQNGVPQITPEEFDDLCRSERVMVLDVRMPNEFVNEGHIAGAHNIPGSELTPTVLSQLQGENAPEALVVNCAGRTRSIVATDQLVSLGVKNVHALQNGTMAWLLAGRALVTGTEIEPLPAPGPEARQQAGELASTTARSLGLAPIAPEDLRRAVESEEFLYIVDVRTPEEFADGHITGAVSCPAGQLTNYLDDTIVVREARIVCYSSDQTRAVFAARTLTGIGYPNVQWLQRGLQGWQQLDAPTETGATAGGRETLEVSLPEHCSRIAATDLSVRPVDGTRKLIDIRQSSDYMWGHVPGAVWVPRGDLERRIGAVAQVSDDLIVVSDDERLARLAAGTLVDLGYLHVAVLADGITAWKQAGLPLSEGSDGSAINMLAAREEADLVGHGPKELRRTEEDMLRYLEWEERLGDKYANDAYTATAGRK